MNSLRAAVCVLAIAWAPAAGQAGGMQEAEQHFQAGRWSEAENGYLAVLSQDSANAMAWYRLGRIALEVHGDGPLAVKRFEEALAHGFAPSFFPHFGLARAHMRSGEREAALARLDTIAMNNFWDPDAVRGDSAFAALAGDARFEAILERIARNAEPCEFIPDARRLDYWIGDWDVFAPGNPRPIGRNRIEKVLRGCALQENWTDGFGREGKSTNVYEPARRSWRQLWIADNGTVTDYDRAVVLSNGVRFEARTTNTAGTPIVRRMSLLSESPDSVRQVIEDSTDDGGTWATVFVGIYVRRRSDPGS